MLGVRGGLCLLGWFRFVSFFFLCLVGQAGDVCQNKRCCGGRGVSEEFEKYVAFLTFLWLF